MPSPSGCRTGPRRRGGCGLGRVAQPANHRGGRARGRTRTARRGEVASGGGYDPGTVYPATCRPGAHVSRAHAVGACASLPGGRRFFGYRRQGDCSVTPAVSSARATASSLLGSSRRGRPRPPNRERLLLLHLHGPRTCDYLVHYSFVARFYNYDM